MKKRIVIVLLVVFGAFVGSMISEYRREQAREAGQKILRERDNAEAHARLAERIQFEHLEKSEPEKGPIDQSKLELVKKLAEEYRSQYASMQDAQKRKQEKRSDTFFYQAILVDKELTNAYSELNDTERDELANTFGEQLLKILKSGRSPEESVREALEETLYAFGEIDFFSSSSIAEKLEQIREAYEADLKKRGLWVEYP